MRGTVGIFRRPRQVGRGQLRVAPSQGDGPEWQHAGRDRRPTENPECQAQVSVSLARTLTSRLHWLPVVEHKC